MEKIKNDIDSIDYFTNNLFCFIKWTIGMGLFFSLFFYNNVQAQKRQLLSPTTSKAHSWKYNPWESDTYYNVVSSPRSDDMTLLIQSDSASVRHFFQKVPLQPNSTYRLEYWIKTENVKSQKGGGAGIRLGKLSLKPDKVWHGTHGWSKQVVRFQVKDDDSMVLEFLLGKRSPAKGKIWIDHIELIQKSHQPFHPSVTIDLKDTRAPMSKYIYGQFIEQMGNAIYGGIWAEMLEDRKFYYPPATSKSPWKFSSKDTTQLVIDSMDAYVGNNSAVLHTSEQATPIFYQGGISIKKSKRYKGHIVLAGNKQVLPVDVILSWGGEPSQKQVVHINRIDRGYKSYPVSFTASATTDSARFAIKPEGTGSLYIGTASLMPADNIEGFRPDVIKLMKELDAPIYRWPGGNFVSGYNWKDGVGKRDKRSPRVDEAWKAQYHNRPWKAVESNDVGIHEFMKLCKILNTEPYIAVNTGLGMAKLAAEEVEYLNGNTDTPMGAWRAKNDHPSPFNVTYFAVGNEMFGDWQLGHMPLKDYVKKHNRVARSMWDVDPDAKLVAVGNYGKWDRQMYQHSSDYMNYISEHFYRQNWHGGGLMTHVKQMPHAIDNIAQEHRRLQKQYGLEDQNLKVAMDEWNYWYGRHIYGLLGTRYFLRDALGIAAGLNAYMRNSDIYFMANYAQTVNVIGAIKVTESNSFMAATGVVLKMYRNNLGYIPVRMSGDRMPFDMVAALTRDKKYITVSVVNPTHKSYTLHLHIKGGDINSKGEAFIVAGKNDMVYNDVSNKDAVSVSKKNIKVRNNAIKISSISATILKFKVK